MCVNVRVCEVSESAGGVGSVLRAHMYIQYICIYSIYIVYTDMDKIVGTPPLKKENPTMVTEIT